MKILLVSDYADYTGGTEMMILRIRDLLRGRGVDARIFATGLTDGAGRNFADYTCFGTRSRFRTLVQSANPLSARGLKRVLDEFRPDVVHVRMFLTQLSPLILPLLRDVPTIYHLAWYRAICPTGTKQLPGGGSCEHRWGRACLSEGCLPLRDWLPLMLQMRMTREHLRVFDRVVANSAAVQARFRAEGIASSVIHNGIPVPELRELKATAPTVLYAGRLASGKGLEVAIESFRQVAGALPEARLVVAGEGPLLAALTRQVRQSRLEGHVRFTGKLAQDALSRELQRAWVTIVPSTWEEPFGIAAVDAAMHARPVIATRTGGLPEIVEDQVTGYLVEAGDPDQLGARMLQLLREPVHAERLGLAARQRAIAKFSIEACVDRFARLYEDLLEGPSRDRSVA